MARDWLTRDEVREVDRRAINEIGIPGAVLMENAGRGAADLLISLGVHGKVLICCGKGNNGGDGLVVARHLHLRGVPFQAILFTNPQELTGEAALNYGIAVGLKLPVEVILPEAFDGAKFRLELATSEWVVDALFGTGLTGAVRQPFDQIIALINDSSARVLAMDTPSGLDCDTGQPFVAVVRARHTVTFVASKKGYEIPESRQWTGKVHVAGIGVK